MLKSGSNSAQNDSFTEKSCYCIVCGERFVNPPTEDWIQCHVCQEWAHEKCTDVTVGSLVKLKSKTTRKSHKLSNKKCKNSGAKKSPDCLYRLHVNYVGTSRTLTVRDIFLVLIKMCILNL